MTNDRSHEKIQTSLLYDGEKTLHADLKRCNIVRLILNTSLSSDWSLPLAHLRHLECREKILISSANFVHFLQNAPSLQSLTLSILTLSELTDQFTNKTVHDQLSSRIKSLTISDHFSYSFALDAITTTKLASLVQIFGQTCEHLSIPLSMQYDQALSLLQEMKQLRTLHITYRPISYQSKYTAKERCYFRLYLFSGWFEYPYMVWKSTVILIAIQCLSSLL